MRVFNSRRGTAVTAAVAGLIATGLLLTSGCTSASGEKVAREPIELNLVVLNLNIRAVGDTCGGTGPFTYVHAKSPYRIEDSQGETVSEGTLPPGIAIKASDLDWGVERIPTLCEFTFNAKVPSDRNSYRLVLEKGKPIEFTKDGSGKAKLELK
jgi:hypothetical protein